MTDYRSPLASPSSSPRAMPSRFPLIPRPRRFPTLLLFVATGSMFLLYLLLSIAPCMAAGNCYHGYASRYSFDADKSHHPKWMASVPDHVNITSLSIPGTHDTMTYEVDSEVYQCQNWDLSTQLNAGLRYFDIRARLRDDALHIYHADVPTGFSYEQVLLGMFSFLEENPTETIVMRLKEESTPLGTNTKTFEEAFNYAREKAPATAPSAAKHLYLYDPRKGPIPTLGELRSKIFILQQFDTDKASPPYGLQWEGSQMSLEDMWIIADVYHLADKWTAIRNALEKASAEPDDNSLLYLAHISASIGVLPIEAAAGPKNRTVDGMNNMTGQWLEDFDGKEGFGRTGIVIYDFPGKEAIEAVLKWNEHLKK